MDWFKGKSTGNHGFSHQIWCFPVKIPLNQSIDYIIFFYQGSTLGRNLFPVASDSHI